MRGGLRRVMGLLAMAALLAALVIGVEERVEVAAASTGPVRIMPLGDSITQADASHASYRRPLWGLLVGAGHDVDFVGSLSTNHGGANPFPDFDLDHEGRWGWRTDQVLGQIVAWATAARPDVVLVHLGTNDLLQSQTAASTTTELRQLVAHLRSVNPEVTIVLSTLIGQTRMAPQTFDDLDARIVALAAELDRAGARVLLNRTPAFDPARHLYDGVHPNEAGELVLARSWYETLAAVLPDPARATTTTTAATTTTTTTTASVSGGTVVVRARGDVGDEEVVLSVAGRDVGTRRVTTSFAEHVFAVPVGASIDQVQVRFVNDRYSPPLDRNLEVDWVRVDGATYQAEGPTVISRGAWTGSGCATTGTFRAQELVCNGFFDFAGIGAPAS